MEGMRLKRTIKTKTNADLHFYNFGISYKISKKNMNIIQASFRFSRGKYPLMLIACSEWLESRHLKYSIYNRVKDKCLNLRLDEWTDLLIESIKSKSIVSFLDEMTKCDYLIIDNIEELKSKDCTQYTFLDVLKKREKAKKHTLLLSEYSYESLEDWMIPELSHYFKKHKIVERIG